MSDCITCTVCQCDIESNILRRHYQTEWHLYNQKRKIASFPPISEHDFLEKAKIAQSAALESNEVKKFHCEICKKKFQDRGPYEQHMSSKQHKRRAEEQAHSVPEQNNKAPITTDEKSIPAEEEDEYANCLGLEECLFCSKVCTSLSNNLQHMEAKHNFIIPDRDLLKDLEGLMTCLDEVVGEERRCLWCLQQFASLKSVQQHMMDKSHTRLQTEGHAWLIYADFYDYTQFCDSDDNAEDDEEDEGAEDADGEAYERVLPSGAVIGSRALRVYYNQYLPKNNTTQKRQHRAQLALVAGGMASLDLLPRRTAHEVVPWSSSQEGILIKQRRRDLAHLQRNKQRYWMKLGTKANKLQHHFRLQINF